MTRRWPDNCVGSPSRIKLYEGCGLAHRFKYVDQLPDPPGPEARVGKLLHAALEAVGRPRIGKPAPPAATGEELHAALGAAVPQIAGDGGVDPADVAAAQEALAQLAPFDVANGGTVLLVEHPMALEVAPGVRFGMYLDLVRELPSGTIEVVDWKSGMVPGQEEADWSAQATLYLSACRELHLAGNAGKDDGREFVCVFVSLSTGEETRVRWTPERDAFGRARAAAACAAWSRGHARARVGHGCRRCPFRGRCEPYQEHLERMAVSALDGVGLEAKALDEILRERVRMAEVAEHAEQRRKDLDVEVRSRLDEDDQRTLEAGGFRASLRERRSGRYDPSLLPELAAQLGRDPMELLRTCVSVSAAGVKKVTKGDENATRLAERYRDPARVRYVEVRAVKNGNGAKA